MEESKAKVTIPISEWNELQQKLSVCDGKLIETLKAALEKAVSESREKGITIRDLESEIRDKNRDICLLRSKDTPLENKIRGLERDIERLDNYNTELITDLTNVKALKWLFYLSAFFNLVLLGSIIALWLRGESEVVILFMLAGGIGSLFGGLTVREEFKEQREKYGK